MNKIIKKFKKLNTQNLYLLNFTRGFTIVETLVALSIFSISVTALIVVSGQGISNTSSASNKVVADYLAQEGVELIRNVRDNAIISIRNNKNTQLAWRAFVNNSTPYVSTDPITTNVPVDGISACISPLKCYVDVNTVGKVQIYPCQGGVCPIFYYNTAKGFYKSIPAGDPTFYKREITVLFPDINNKDEVRVDSKVFWGHANSQHSVSYSQYLFNWPGISL